jgi:shikimate kinase
MTPPPTTAVHKVVLVGPRAAGKTTLGKTLAATLGWGFVDTDDLVAAATGQPASDYLNTAGEAAFRKVEEQVTRIALAGPDREVLALGGGAVLSAEIRAALAPGDPKTRRLVVFLRAPVQALVERQQAAPRPALTGRPLRDEITVLLAARWRYYESVSQMQLDTSSANVDACQRSIMAKMGLTS